MHVPQGAVRGQEQFWRAAVPGGFNDPDMLVVGVDGMYPYGIVQQCPPAVPDCTPGEYITRQRWGKVGGLTPDEQRTHFALWCMMASPLLLGNDPRSISAEALEARRQTPHPVARRGGGRCVRRPSDRGAPSASLTRAHRGSALRAAPRCSPQAK